MNFCYFEKLVLDHQRIQFMCGVRAGRSKRSKPAHVRGAKLPLNESLIHWVGASEVKLQQYKPNHIL